jgi:hypothetical protein
MTGTQQFKSKFQLPAARRGDAVLHNYVVVISWKKPDNVHPKTTFFIQ